MVARKGTYCPGGAPGTTPETYPKRIFPRGDIRREKSRVNTPWFTLLLRYANFVTAMMSQTAACNRLHTLDERMSRWLLTTLLVAQRRRRVEARGARGRHEAGQRTDGKQQDRRAEEDARVERPDAV